MVADSFGGLLAPTQQAMDGLLAQNPMITNQLTGTIMASSSNWQYHQPQTVMQDPLIGNNDPVAWLRQRVRDIEWRA